MTFVAHSAMGQSVIYTKADTIITPTVVDSVQVEIEEVSAKLRTLREEQYTVVDLKVESVLLQYTGMVGVGFDMEHHFGRWSINLGLGYMYTQFDVYTNIYTTLSIKYNIFTGK